MERSENGFPDAGMMLAFPRYVPSRVTMQYFFFSVWSVPVRKDANPVREPCSRGVLSADAATQESGRNSNRYFIGNGCWMRELQTKESGSPA